MDKTVAGLLTAVGGALAVASPAGAVTVHDALHADSYADLLRPVPNAVAVQQAIAEAQAAAPDVMTVQFLRHHHHHHHRYYRRRFYHHHHHHHHGPALIIR
jgi:hypothetical protein